MWITVRTKMIHDCHNSQKFRHVGREPGMGRTHVAGTALTTIFLHFSSFLDRTQYTLFVHAFPYSPASEIQRLSYFLHHQQSYSASVSLPRELQRAYICQRKCGWLVSKEDYTLYQRDCTFRMSRQRNTFWKSKMVGVKLPS
jgi:hypothetical protein